MNPAEELLKKIEEIRTIIDEMVAKMEQLGQSLEDLVRLLPAVIANWVVEQYNTAVKEVTKFIQKYDPVVEPTVNKCLDQIALAQFAPKFCAVNFTRAEYAVGPDNLGPKRDDWTSPNTEIYRLAAGNLPTKLTNLKDGVQDICQYLGDFADDLYSWLIGALVAFAGMAIAIAGVVIAIISLATGAVPVAIVGLVVAVLGLAPAVASIFILPDIEGLRATTAERIRGVADSVGGATWTAAPSLSGSW